MRIHTSAAFALAGACLAASTIISPGAQAEPIETNDADPTLASLVRLLKTRIATRDAEEYSDETPGIVTVIEGGDLRSLGIATVRDALSLVPGIALPEPQIARDEPVVRGVGGFFTGSSGKMRYMVDGVVTNNIYSANSTEALEIPVELVERIEVIRGPGSAVHGEYAYLGTLNVVTRRGNAVGVRADSFDGLTAYAATRWGSEESARSSLSVSTAATDGDDRMAGLDRLYAIGAPTGSNAPGLAHTRKHAYSVFYHLDSGNVSLKAFALGKRRADGFGIANALSSNDDPVQKIGNMGFELDWQPTIGDWHVDMRIAAKRFRREYDELEVFPRGFLGIYPNGLIASSSEVEDRIEGGVSMHRHFHRHRLLAGVEFSRSDASDLFLEKNFDEENLLPGPVPLASPLEEPREFPWGYEGRERTVKSVFISDQYQVSKPVVATFGIRYDDYSDAGDATSPRMNLSYRINQKHLLKTQVARAFRPPTFLELYSRIGPPAGNPDLDPEIVDSIEFSHIFRGRDLVLHTSAYSSHLDGLIRTDASDFFINSRGVRTRGLEFDFDYRSGPSLRWFGNLSYIHAIDLATNERVAGSTDWLANLGVAYRKGSRFSGTLRYRYVGERFRAPGDSRSDLEDYGTVSLSLNYFDVFRPGVTVRFGIDNLLDADFRKPAPALTYADDYPGESRRYWLSVSKDFR